ncbi:hypothetical protein L210DRAFT_3629282 [Boletus edulis BED1]|uniref:Uncharacterized protein n=1 Tax=Boletus edulis BED1 TaxID=1328754 RepID=A0AAD4GHB2_BOLED|nr:hypothetical protein L210DRAFT_3629282 [Boletus edulis BED1]
MFASSIFSTSTFTVGEEETDLEGPHESLVVPGIPEFSASPRASSREIETDLGMPVLGDKVTYDVALDQLYYGKMERELTARHVDVQSIPGDELGVTQNTNQMTGEQITTYSEDGEIHERDEYTTKWK